MSAIASHIDNSSSTARKAMEGRRYFHAPNGWKLPILFMLSMTAIGLSFYPAWLVVIAIILYYFKTDRYEALITIIIAIGGYGFREHPTTIECTLIYACAIPLMFLMRKTEPVRKILIVWCVYAAGCLVFASLSLESLKGQALTLMWYLSFAFIFIPLALFAGKSFSMDDFFNRLYPYAMIFMAFYWVDGIVLCAPVMLPQLQPFVGLLKFYQLYVFPFSTIARVHPAGFYLPLMLMYPLVRSYKLRPWELILSLVALGISKTFALISGVFVALIICQKGFGKTSKYLVLSASLFAALYAVDLSISDVASITTPEGSKLRIASTVTQFVALDSAEDESDLAEFGTGRMAQIIPKVERLYQMKLEWTGFGFLHTTKTDNPIFMLENPYYSDIENNYESVAAVEVIPVQVFLNMGYLGLIWHILYLLALVLCIRKLPDAKYAWTMMVIFIWLGISGFCGMLYTPGQMIVATAFAMVILQDKTRRGINCKESPTPFLKENR